LITLAENGVAHTEFMIVETSRKIVLASGLAATASFQLPDFYGKASDAILALFPRAIQNLRVENSTPT